MFYYTTGWLESLKFYFILECEAYTSPVRLSRSIYHIGQCDGEVYGLSKGSDREMICL